MCPWVQAFRKGYISWKKSRCGGWRISSAERTCKRDRKRLSAPSFDWPKDRKSAIDPAFLIQKVESSRQKTTTRGRTTQPRPWGNKTRKFPRPHHAVYIRFILNVRPGIQCKKYICQIICLFTTRYIKQNSYYTLLSQQ